MTAFIESLEERTMMSRIYTVEPLAKLAATDTATETILFKEHFNGKRVNRARWSIPEADGFWMGRAQMRSENRGGAPKVSGGAAHLSLDTYNPFYPGGNLLGTELMSKDSFSLGDNKSVSVEFRAKLAKSAKTPWVGGSVMGLFMYTANESHEELDYEILSNKVATNQKEIDTVIFTDKAAVLASSVKLPKNFSFFDYHVYTMTWEKDVGVMWYVDGGLVRIDGRYTPTGPLNITMNFWAPWSSWTNAYNSDLKPTSVQSENQRYTIDIDSVVVKAKK